MGNAKDFLIRNEIKSVFLPTGNKGYLISLEDLLERYAREETQIINDLLDKQNDEYLTPEVQQELLDLIKTKGN